MPYPRDIAGRFILLQRLHANNLSSSTSKKAVMQVRPNGQWGCDNSPNQLSNVIKCWLFPLFTTRIPSGVVYRLLMQASVCMLVDVPWFSYHCTIMLTTWLYHDCFHHGKAVGVCASVSLSTPKLDRWGFYRIVPIFGCYSVGLRAECHNVTWFSDNWSNKRVTRRCLGWPIR